MNYQMKAILFRKGEKGKSTHKMIDVESFTNLLKSPEYIEKLQDGKLLGLLTHESRKKARESHIPHVDTVAIDPNLLNVMRDWDEDDDCVYGYFDLLDTEAATRFKNLVRMGVKFGVSISTELVELADRFIIKKLNGVDCTIAPEYSAPILEMNFSEDESGTANIFNSNAEVKLGDFSQAQLKAHIMESNLRPNQILRERIRDVIAYTKMWNANKVGMAKPYLKSYIAVYVKSAINKAMKSNEVVNLTMYLGLQNYMQSLKPARDLQMALKRARDQLSTSGVMTSDVQRGLNKSFSDTMNEIYDYINKKAKTEEGQKAL